MSVSTEAAHLSNQIQRSFVRLPRKQPGDAAAPPPPPPFYERPRVTFGGCLRGRGWEGSRQVSWFYSRTFPSAFPGDGYLFRRFRDTSRRRASAGSVAQSPRSCDPSSPPVFSNAPCQNFAATFSLLTALAYSRRSCLLLERRADSFRAGSILTRSNLIISHGDKNK